MSARKGISDTEVAQLRQLETLVLDALFLIDRHPEGFQALVDFGRRLRLPLHAGARLGARPRASDSAVDWTVVPPEIERAFALFLRRMKGEE